MNEILKCENLNKKFGMKEILKNISFEIYESDIVGFIGPNGSGKTTTIKCILGLNTINSGNVYINGHSIKTNFEDAIRNVGAIVENPDFYMYLSGYDNLKLYANLYNNISKERIEEVVKLVKLENRIKDKVSKYSLGMRQRLGIAQAILHKPNLLVLDEPTNGLDPEGIKELRDTLKDLANKEKMSILISSHNLSEIENLCNKVCIIQNGKIVETSYIKDLKIDTSSNLYLFEVSDTKKVSSILKNIKIYNKNKFSIKSSKENINNIIKLLIENNINIYEIQKNTISLEEAFLNRTGGNEID